MYIDRIQEKMSKSAHDTPTNGKLLSLTLKRERHPSNGQLTESSLSSSECEPPPKKSTKIYSTNDMIKGPPRPFCPPITDKMRRYSVSLKNITEIATNTEIMCDQHQAVLTKMQELADMMKDPDRIALRLQSKGIMCDGPLDNVFKYAKNDNDKFLTIIDAVHEYFSEKAYYHFAQALVESDLIHVAKHLIKDERVKLDDDVYSSFEDSHADDAITNATDCSSDVTSVSRSSNDVLSSEGGEQSPNSNIHVLMQETSNILSTGKRKSRSGKVVHEDGNEIKLRKKVKGRQRKRFPKPELPVYSGSDTETDTREFDEEERTNRRKPSLNQIIPNVPIDPFIEKVSNSKIVKKAWRYLGRKLLGRENGNRDPLMDIVYARRKENDHYYHIHDVLTEWCKTDPNNAKLPALVKALRLCLCFRLADSLIAEASNLSISEVRRKREPTPSNDEDGDNFLTVSRLMHIGVAMQKVSHIYQIGHSLGVSYEDTTHIISRCHWDMTTTSFEVLRRWKHESLKSDLRLQLAEALEKHKRDDIVRRFKLREHLKEGDEDTMAGNEAMLDPSQAQGRADVKVIKVDGAGRNQLRDEHAVNPSPAKNQDKSQISNQIEKDDSGHS